MTKLKFLSGNALKILAAIAMVFDHVGLLFFPTNMLFRKIGRISFPIFAFLLAEGCKYTKDKKKHFLQLFILAVVCQLVYLVAAGDTYLSVLVTLSIAQVCIFALQYFKKNLFDAECKPLKKAICFLPFVLAVAGAALIDCFAQIDYGFWGCMLPVFVSLFDFKGIENKEVLQKLDSPLLHFLCFALGVTVLILTSSSPLPKEYAFLSLIPVFFYNGQRGKWNMKYFFYLFYPLHLVLLEAIYVVWYILSIS